jgi:putative hydrolase of the HAD superfamily
MPAPIRPTWFFDLDDTLHHASPLVFPEMNRLMTEWVMHHLQLDHAAANALRQTYWRRYGATLLGLMQRHAVNPKQFLADTHRFDDLAALLVTERGLRAHLQRLRGRKVVFSNAPRQYVLAVLQHMGIAHLFDGVATMETLRYRPKPSRAAMAKIFHRFAPRGGVRIMVEDNLDNLKTARYLGLKTIWFARPAMRRRARPHYVDRKVQSLRVL